MQRLPEGKALSGVCAFSFLLWSGGRLHGNGDVRFAQETVAPRALH